MEEVNKIEEKGGIWRCGAWEETYPDRLRCYEGMPGMLYTKGCLPQEEKKTVAIVGARACSAYGAHQAYTFAKILAEHGVQIIRKLKDALIVGVKGSRFAMGNEIADRIQV